MTEEALRERVAELEARLDATTRAQAEHERTATDPQGRQWTVSDLMGMGLTRRQALGAIGAIAGGATLASALSGQVAAQPTGDEGAVGEQGDRVEGWFSEVDALEVATGQVNTADLTAGAAGEFLESDGSGDLRLTAAVQSETADQRLEHGSVSHSDPGQASDGTWDSSTSDVTSVAFDTAFSTAPTVIMGSENVDGGIHHATNISTTGFDSQLTWYRSDFSAGRNARWIAVGDD